MKKSILYLMLLLFTACTEDLIGEDILDDVIVEDSVSTLYDQSETWLNQLCSKEFYGRKTGSIGDSLACSYLKEELIKMGYTPISQEFYTESGIRLENIIVNIQGNNDSTVIIGAHYDGAKLSSANVHYPAAEDNGSGVVALLAFLKLQQDFSLNTPYTIMCCFWDSEEVFEGRAFRGSSFFVSNLQDKGIVLFYENLDTMGHEHDGTVRIRYWDWGNGRLTDALSSLIANGRFNYIEEPTPSGGSSDYAVFNGEKIPFIAYHDHDSAKPCSHPNHSVADRPEFISIDKILKIVDNTREMIETY